MTMSFPEVLSVKIPFLIGLVLLHGFGTEEVIRPQNEKRSHPESGAIFQKFINQTVLIHSKSVNGN